MVGLWLWLRSWWSVTGYPLGRLPFSPWPLSPKGQNSAYSYTFRYYNKSMIKSQVKQISPDFVKHNRKIIFFVILRRVARVVSTHQYTSRIYARNQSAPLRVIYPFRLYLIPSMQLCTNIPLAKNSCFPSTVKSYTFRAMPMGRTHRT